MKTFKQSLIAMLAIMGLGMMPTAFLSADEYSRGLEGKAHEMKEQHQLKEIDRAELEQARHEMKGYVDEQLENRLSTLKDELEITPEQERAYDKWASTVEEQANETMEKHAAEVDTLLDKETVTPADRIEMKMDMHKQQAENLKKLKGPTEDLWEVLDENQRAMARDMLSQPFGGKKGPKGYK